MWVTQEKVSSIGVALGNNPTVKEEVDEPLSFTLHSYLM